MELTDSISLIKGIGEKTEKLFNKLGIKSVGELLTFYPRRYESYLDPTPIKDLKENETGVILGLVSRVTEPKFNSRVKVLTCVVSDGNNEIELIWFNEPYIKYELKSGYHFIFRGTVKRKGKKLQLEQAKVYKREDYYRLQSALQPVYPLTHGLSNKIVTKAVKSVLTNAGDFPEFIPLAVRKEHGLIKKSAAINEMHFPKRKDSLIEARKSLVFEEFFLFKLFLKNMGKSKNLVKSAYEFKDFGAVDEFIKNLPFRLTIDQQTVIDDIKKDFMSGHVMARLVMGDVGSGKTVIAETALLIAASNGYQGAIMAPTEVLAAQHYKLLSKDFSAFGIRCTLLTGSMTQAEKRKAYKDIKEKNTDIVIGTHTLFQENLEFHSLSLCITDEQHRFGVKQRENFLKKGENPHVLVMSATPIPRTLAMMVYGDMDISKISTVPSTRLPIKNCVVGTSYREAAYKFIYDEVKKGGQAYVICPMVDSDEDSSLQNVTDYSEKLRERYKNEIKVEMLHGKMKPQEKNKIMSEFASGNIDVLVSTTVVEVGVNVPNATTMLIENANRFGLAELHQLRGRVGRGDKQSYCVFMYDNVTEEGKERLNTLVKSNDGFFIAEEDLRLRGPGDIFGSRQSGEMYFKIADIYNDADILKNASDAADKINDKETENILQKMYESGAKDIFPFFDNYGTI